eukprot:1875983-Pyramimonas_sp.AAC.1
MAQNKQNHQRVGSLFSSPLTSTSPRSSPAPPAAAAAAPPPPPVSPSALRLTRQMRTATFLSAACCTGADARSGTACSYPNGSLPATPNAPHL